MKNTEKDFFTARIQSIPLDRPLCFDIFLKVAGEFVHFRKIGDVITQSRMDELLNRKLKEMLVRNEHREVYLKSLRDIVKDVDLKPEVRGRFIKESAFNHITDLFNNNNVKHIAQESTGLVEDMVEFISTDIEAAAKLMGLSSHDYYTYNHSVNVSVYSIAICKRVLGEDKKLLVTAGLGGLLHDLGKKKIDTSVINKPGKLTPEEWVEMKKHPGYGYELLAGISTISDETRRIVHEHHEHMDGTGYPKGLSDNQILKLARIASVADVFDALTTKRSYKEACGAIEALQIMAGMPEGKFDREIFKFFEGQNANKIPVTIDKNADPCSPGLKLKKTG